MTSDFSRQAFGSFGKLDPGTRVAGYLIEEQVGAGGMAVVFRAHDEVLGRPAALRRDGCRLELGERQLKGVGVMWVFHGTQSKGLVEAV